MTWKDKQNHIFLKSKSYEISSTVIYIGEDREFIIHIFYWCIPLGHEIYTKCKKTSNLIKGISSHNICSGTESQKVQKSFVIQYQKLSFFSEFLCSISSSRFTFKHSISCALLIDKPNESC